LAGSRDKRLAFWSIPDELNPPVDLGGEDVTYPTIQPVQHFQGSGNQDKVRGMVYNSISEVCM